MAMKNYPKGVDCVWLATDKNGCLGAFVTAGEGPIPIQALASEIIPVDEIEIEVNSLQRTSDARLMATVPRPDDFIDMAERGFFVYDWSDIHRKSQERIHAYELVAVPTQPLTSLLLPKNLKSLVSVVQFKEIKFRDQKALDLIEEFGADLIVQA